MATNQPLRESFPSSSHGVSRRGFLAAGAASALPVGGFLIGFAWPMARAQQVAAGPQPLSYQPNAWVRIAPDNSVTVVSHKVEMGQGAYTGVTLLIAEELEVDARRIQVVAAPPGAVYADPALGGFQMTGGSSSMRSGWEALRRVGATARIVLVEAAAAQWRVPPAECSVSDGVIEHRASNRRLPYGAVADAAMKRPAPNDVSLKPEAAFTQVGKPVTRLDAAVKTDGSAVFGIDIVVPGMSVASLLLAPSYGATLVAIENEVEVLRMPGVQQVLRFEDFAAVLGSGFFAAKRGSEALKARWKPGSGAALSSAGIAATLRTAERGPMATARIQGDVAGALARSKRRVEASYSVPFLAHATMEPMNCTVAYLDGKAEVWVGTQVPVFATQAVAQVGGIAPESVTLHTPFLGGGFGRRLEVDVIVRAARVAKAAGRPVKTVYSRENDVRGDLFRMSTFNRLEAALGPDGLPLAWQHRIAGGSIYARYYPPIVKDGIDDSSVEGAADLLYAIPNQKVELAIVDTGVPVAFWRSVGFSQNTFVVESFLDECALAARLDPLVYRQKLVAGDARFGRVLATLAQRSNWGKAAKGRFRGVAAAKPFGTYVGAVVEVQMTGKSQFRLTHVWVVVDAGKLVAPDVCLAQIQSGVVFGLTAALFGEITFDQGRVQQSNFSDYRMLTLAETPAIDVHFIDSSADPGGIGEPGVPCMAPALTNALFAANGKRLRSLPVVTRAFSLA